MSKEFTEWHKAQIRAYQAEKPVYDLYAETVMKILKRATDKVAPLSIIQARPKAIPSFAEKAVRKAHKYRDPVHQLTDLCGGRVITITLKQMHTMCAFIKEHFVVDEMNSLDVGSRLGATEFGYRSVHYVVQMKPGDILGIEVPNEILPNETSPHKAEIQVRTLLQHAWSELSHDRIYKNEIKVPEPFVRESARLAAVLEEAEDTFARFVENIDSYVVNYGAYMDEARMQSELDTLAAVLENEANPPTRISLALRIARLAKARGDWERIDRELTPHAGAGDPVVLRELGNALCQLNRNNPASDGYARGQRLMQQATDADPKDAEAYALLADSWQRVRQSEKKARDLYRKAFDADPSNPYHLTSFLEYEISCERSASVLGPLAPTLRAAIAKCQGHVDAGIELPWAYFTMGKLHFLLGEPYESLTAYAKAVQMCVALSGGLPEEVFDDELDCLLRMEPAQSALPGREWVRRFLFEGVRRLLLLGKSVKFHPDAPLRELHELRRAKYAPGTRVLIVAGGCDTRFHTEMQAYEDLLFRALESLSGVVLSGGTTAGISGIVGAIAARAAERNGAALEAVGYHPARMPAGVALDTRYTRQVETEGDDFSPLDELQAWIDLVASGIKPSEVRLLGVNGDRIAAFEYRLALALGARVGVVEGSGRAAAEIAQDAEWSDAKGLVVLPPDPMTLRAFVNPEQTTLTGDNLEKAARAVHAKYREDNKHKIVDPAMVTWDELPDHLKSSNRSQASYAAQILAQAGYGVRPAQSEAIKLPTFTKEEIEVMGEMEHGRWNVERISDGWTFGPRDPKNKVSPYLVSWDRLPDDIRKWDRDAVENFPEMLKQAGLEVYKL